jgi:hypothetical protein
MLKPEARALLLATLASCLLLAGCGDAAPDASAKPTAGRENKAPKAVALTEDMVAAVAPGTSTRVVGVYFAMRKAPAVNEGLPLEIALVPHQEFSSLVAHFFSQDGLTLVSGDTFGPVSDPKPGTPIKHQVVLMPLREGLYMVSVTVDSTGAEGMVSRVFSIPLVVPPVAAPASTPAAVPEKPSVKPAPAS